MTDDLPLPARTALVLGTVGLLAGALLMAAALTLAACAHARCTRR